MKLDFSKLRKTKVSMPRWTDLKKQRNSVAAVLIVALALLVVDTLWVEPLRANKDILDAKIRQQEETIHKLEQKLNQVQGIRENLAKQEKDLQEMRKRLFRGTDPYQLAASLGDLLSSKTGDKIEIKTYQVLASKEYGLYQEVHLRFNLMTSVEGLFSFLDRVKNSEFAMLVQEINIQKIQKARGPDLVINVILAALMEKGEKT
jgi:hypothetical protein